MSAVVAWLETRRPAPPGSLRPWLSPQGRDGERLYVALTAAGCHEMESARVRLGPVRESALHLLAADALITYACEAALEEDDPKAALSDVLRVVVSPASRTGET